MSKFVPIIVFRLAALFTAAVIVASALVPAGECSHNSNAQFGRSDSTTVNYKVEEGDTLYGIAGEHRVAVRELMRVNNLEGSLIRPGDVLLVPDKKSYGGAMSRGVISREELMLLARLIHAEARGESFEGQVAVGAVILNRLASPNFPKSIPEIVYQRSHKVYQFSPVGDGSINLKPDESAVQAAVQALSGRDPTGGALFFYNPDISKDQWIRTLPVVTRIGNHVFATSL